jgi:hypothetical protein
MVAAFTADALPKAVLLAADDVGVGVGVALAAGVVLALAVVLALGVALGVADGLASLAE